MHRRTFARSAAVTIGALIAGPMISMSRLARVQAAWDPEITTFDMVMGVVTAPVTMLEFASFTCPHCARFHAETFPSLKARYIDTGKVRFVFRDFPLDGLALRAGLLARCGGAARYFAIVDVLFASQERWTAAADPVAELRRIGLLAGLTAAEVDRCLADDTVAARILAMKGAAANRLGIDSTPSFIVQGQRLVGNLRIDRLAAVIDTLLAS